MTTDVAQQHLISQLPDASPSICENLTPDSMPKTISRKESKKDPLVGSRTSSSRRSRSRSSASSPILSIRNRHIVPIIRIIFIVSII